MRISLFLFLGILFLVPFATADAHLPPGLLKVQEYNDNMAAEVLQNVSFFIAFLAGIISILSPCILPFLPVYFAVTFKEKKRITLATFLFFLGFTTIFIIMGLLATLTGNTLISVFSGISWLVPAVGLFLIFFGILIVIGKGFSGLITQHKFRDDPLGILASGAAFAVGWTACIGPILSGVLLMTAIVQNYVTAAYLMFAYALGLFVPLFILSFFYDKIHLEKMSWLRREITLKLGCKKLQTTVPNLIAGSLFVLLGLVFVVFRGTWIVNGLQLFGLKQYFYSAQNFIFENASLFNTLGVVLFIFFAAVLSYFLIRQMKNGSS